MVPLRSAIFSQMLIGASEDYSAAQQCSIDDPRQQLLELECEISRVEALLAKLVQRRVPLKRKINRRFAPMLSLPVELCSEIFTTCFPPTWDTEGTCSPLILGQVCTAWRNLAWSMPWLWNNVFLSSTRPTPAHVELLEEWIARSANLPLSIHLRLKIENADVDMRDVTHLMDAVARCSKRWRTINFEVPFFFPADPYVSNLIPTKFPILTSAAIQVEHVRTPLNLFIDAPQLQDVQLIGFPRNSFDLPWDHITRLRLNPTTVQQCLELLGTAPNLIHCIFENITRSDVVNPTPILAPSLQSLEVISFTHTPISELLDTLRIPNVLDLSFHVTGNTFPHWSFISLMVRSSCVLQRLSLNAVRISEWQLWECLEAVPSLLSLRLINIDRLSNDTIRVLNPQNHTMLGSQKYLLPMLQELVYTGALEINFLAMANTLYSRWMGVGASVSTPSADNVAQLQSFKFTTSAPAVFGTDEKVQLGHMQQLVKEGMDISLVTREGAWV
ncbi:hypothetical protein D9615_008199 [Tricholomella constricta]|uniref:F-box domain-containing protein n=1 Tax=Tricholomella constricta TaxID=117010 RepID=A0A8H5H382_9AGAR|nr:hypothetical protein D9615_008199 [Tricholomella constricta]